MQCRSCGTEIADKAIICFRCGGATKDPVRQPYVAKRRSLLPLISAGMLLVVAGAGVTVFSADPTVDIAGASAAAAGLGVSAAAVIRRLRQR